MWWSKRHSSETVRRVQSAYPRAFAADVVAVLRIVPVGRLALSSDDLSPVIVDGEVLSRPYRVYFPEPPRHVESGLTTRQRLILATLYTRHHDGHVRERRLRQAILSADKWVVPFVVQLLGEYVIEIAQAIEDLGVLDPDVYGAFVSDNEVFVERICARIVSYWNAYYRRHIPDLTEYVFYRAARDIGVWNGRIPRRRL